jgi:hypothetical protein
MNPEGRQTLRQWKDNRFRDEPEIADLVDEIEAEEEAEKNRPDDGLPTHDLYDEESEP